MLIEENLEEIWVRIRGALLRARRGADEVRLIAVSKTYPPEAVDEALRAGQADFGENRVQELEAKAEAVGGAARWHLIGTLQRNKVRRVLPLVEVIHSVDSVELAQAIDRVAGEEGLHVRALLQVNVSGEETKHGFSPEAVAESIESLLQLRRVDILGLMTMAPVVKDPRDAGRYFAALRALRDRLQLTGGVTLPALSMGMSSDFEVAIEEGATMVRVGSAIFGSRS